jgi:hypothetical protein
VLLHREESPEIESESVEYRLPKFAPEQSFETGPDEGSGK